jgi:hypothetical protein
MIPATPAQPQAILAKVRVGKVAANLVCLALTIVLCGGGVLIAQLLPWHIPFAEWHIAALVVGLIIQTVAHEALHALGLRVFAGIGWRQIRFGVMWIGT